MRKYLIIVLFNLFGLNSFGDTYPLPKDTFYKSDNGKFLFKVEPSSIYDDKTNNIINRKSTYGILYDIQSKDTIQIWKSKLINRNTPPQVFVSNNGRYVVTSGEWYGTSKYNSIVIYGKSGKIIKKHDFYDIVPKGLIFEWSSITQLYWKEKMYFKNENSFVIEIVSNGHKKGKVNFEKQRINLKTGHVIQNRKLLSIAKNNRNQYDENLWNYFKIPPPPKDGVLDIIGK